jgi:hypothetical protein
MSYLGFGRDHAYQRLDSTLIVENQKKIDTSSETPLVVYNPCHRKGYTNTPVSHPNCVITGTGNYLQCVRTIEHYLFNVTLPNQPPHIPGTILDQGLLSLKSASGQKGLIATEVFYYVREDITDSGSINNQGDQGKWQNHNIDYWMNLNAPTVNQLGHSVCQGDGDGLDPMIASLREDSCFTIGFQTSFLKHIGVAPHSTQANQHPQIVKNMNGIQVEWAIGAAIQHLGIYRNSNTYVSTPTKEKLEWSESETIVFALAVTFAVLSGLAVLAKVISSTDIASTIGNRLFLDKYATRGGRRRKAKNSDVKKGKYKRVNNTEEEGGVRLARGPVAIKWKTSDEGTGFEMGYKDEVV